jgi:hypothetical protein
VSSLLAQNSLEFLISSSARSASERLVLSSQIEQRKASEEPGMIRVCALARLKLHAIELWVIRHRSRRFLSTADRGLLQKRHAQ